MNIVSIDFDIIMAPSIEFYNNILHKNKKIFDEPLMQVCNADLIHYTRLTKWITKKARALNSENIVFIESHEQILNYINQDDTLINIDHHHDLGYTTEDKNINCGNWANYLLKNNIIKEYIWINNHNSTPAVYTESKYKIRDFKSYDLSEIHPDKIIICYSSQWIPPQYRPLFYLWIDLISQIHNTKYEIIENK